MSDEVLTILYDHYKDTCEIIKEAVKRRDKLVLFIAGVLTLFAFQAFYPSTTYETLNQFLGFQFGVDLKVNFSAVGSVIWFFLTILVLRYFQTQVFVERQYDYIHKIEEKLNKLTSGEFITREGKNYLSNYPRFSNWIWFLYTQAFPLLLFLIGVTKILQEWISSHWTFGKALILNTILALCLLISIALYIEMLHFKRKKGIVG